VNTEKKKRRNDLDVSKKDHNEVMDRHERGIFDGDPGDLGFEAVGFAADGGHLF